MTGSGSEIPRRYQRYLLPSALAVVVGNFSPETGAVTLEGKLWDISPLGACLVVPKAQAIDVGCRGGLLVCDPHTTATVSLVAEVRWIEPAPQVTFMGLMFIDGRLPENTFLASFFKESWVDAMEMRRLQDLH